MGSSHSHSHRQVEPFINGANSFGHELDKKGIEYVQASLGITHGEKAGILSWWKHFFSRLTRSGKVHTHDETLTPEIQHLNSILTNDTFDSDCDTSLSFINQYSAENEYLSARDTPSQEGPKSYEAYILVANDSSHIDRMNSPNDRHPTKTENGVSSSQRSRSPALPYVKMKRRCLLTSSTASDPELEEISIAHAEVMYTRATWRMYERITSSRTKATVVNQRFCLPTALPMDSREGKNQRFQKLPHRKHDHYGRGTIDTETSLRHVNFIEDEAQDDQILGSSLSVDRHHTCFEMDHD